MKILPSTPRGYNSILLSVLLWCLPSTKCLSAEIYAGEPLGEAIFDLSSTAVPIGHALNAGSALTRTEVFKLRDGRLLALISIADSLGQPFSIKELKISSSAESPLTKESPSVSKVEFPGR